MPINPARETDISGGTNYKLIDQPITYRFEYNPETSEATIRVDFMQLLNVDGNTRNINLGTAGHVSVGWNELIGPDTGAEEFRNLFPAYSGATDPISGADLTQISMRGVLRILNDMYDRLYGLKIAP